MKQEKYAVIVNESLVESIMKDTITFIMLAGLLLFNHYLLSGSTVIDIAFILLAFILIATKKSKSVFKGNIKESIEYLEGKR